MAAAATVILENEPFTLEQMPFRRLYYQRIVVFLCFFFLLTVFDFFHSQPSSLILCSIWTITKKGNDSIIFSFIALNCVGKLIWYFGKHAKQKHAIIYAVYVFTWQPLINKRRMRVMVMKRNRKKSKTKPNSKETNGKKH